MKAKSIPSLAAGVGFGIILAGGAYMNGMEPPKPLLALVATVLLGGMMGKKFAKSKKFMPAGLISLMSVLVLIRLIIVYGKYLPSIQ